MYAGRGLARGVVFQVFQVECQVGEGCVVGVEDMESAWPESEELENY